MCSSNPRVPSCSGPATSATSASSGPSTSASTASARSAPRAAWPRTSRPAARVDQPSSSRHPPPSPRAPCAEGCRLLDGGRARLLFGRIMAQKRWTGQPWISRDNDRNHETKPLLYSHTPQHSAEKCRTTPRRGSFNQRYFDQRWHSHGMRRFSHAAPHLTLGLTPSDTSFRRPAFIQCGGPTWLGHLKCAAHAWPPETGTMT
ncbi:hypothetical protein B0T11DRAFT_129527 [Plectosphaerella cucumerina]|uniref:Uncharacterized protein n=1 Tax=Plectosphaerella cucumerina TaxID=40658 RepID=A0A8K0WZK4_9PEZI|nr:hypothetical protein B0T11DRAFT_129527 [Plectosphaerella cucumerina]